MLLDRSSVKNLGILMLKKYGLGFLLKIVSNSLIFMSLHHITLQKKAQSSKVNCHKVFSNINMLKGKKIWNVQDK